MPKSNEREYRTMPVMSIRKAEEGEAESYIVEGYATTFEEPYVLYHNYDGKEIMEVIDRHALDETDMRDVIMQFDHNGRVFARNKNGTLTLTVDDHGLKIRADLGSTENSRSLYEDIKAGLIDQMSFAFTITEESYDKEKRTYRVLRIGRLYDVSAVSIPANPGTDISAARKRSLDGVIQDQRAERLAQTERQIKMLKLRIRLQEEI